MAGDTKNPKPPTTPGRKRDRQHDTIVEDRIQRPKKHKVLMHNDDYTPMEFVVKILETIFHRSPAESTRIMLTVHTSGIGIAGVYSREIAETKATRSVQFAREQGYPLMVNTEPE